MKHVLFRKKYGNNISKGNFGQVAKEYLQDKERKGFQFTFKGKDENKQPRTRRCLKNVFRDLSVPTFIKKSFTLLDVSTLPSLTHRRRRGDMIFTYKLMTGKTNISKHDFFTSTNVTTRGHQFKIFKRHASKLPRINTFSNRIVNNWNQLPSKIVASKLTKLI